MSQDDQKIDLEEIVRQQEEYIIKLEMDLVDLTDKWKYLQEELVDIQIEKEFRKMLKETA